MTDLPLDARKGALAAAAGINGTGTESKTITGVQEMRHYLNSTLHKKYPEVNFPASHRHIGMSEFEHVLAPHPTPDSGIQVDHLKIPDSVRESQKGWSIDSKTLDAIGERFTELSINSRRETQNGSPESPSAFGVLLNGVLKHATRTIVPEQEAIIQKNVALFVGTQARGYTQAIMYALDNPIPRYPEPQKASTAKTQTLG